MNALVCADMQLTFQTSEGTLVKEDEYKNSFGLGTSPDLAKAERALQHALDIRKFEIGLYWQRATYFWTLIAATFAGYFAVLSAEHMIDKKFNAYVIACVGLIFSLAWFLTNRGSKYWQENWENHVDMLENKCIGPLYKTILQRSDAKGVFSTFEGPAPFSVSQINQWISLFTLAIWFFLIWYVLPEFNLNADISLKHCIVGFITVVAFLMLLFKTKSNINNGAKHVMSVKRVTIIDD